MDDEALPYVEEDWDCPEQTEVDKRVQPDFPFTMETRQGKRLKKQEEMQSIWQGFRRGQNSFERCKELDNGPGRNSGSTRDRPG